MWKAYISILRGHIKRIVKGMLVAERGRPINTANMLILKFFFEFVSDRKCLVVPDGGVYELVVKAIDLE